LALSVLESLLVYLTSDKYLLDKKKYKKT